MKYGRLEMTDENLGKNKSGKRLCRCTCECGKTIEPVWYNVISGNTQSCGCYQIEQIRKSYALKSHGIVTDGKESYQVEHAVWYGMLDRCENPKSDNYCLYGGRGIKVCARWKKFKNFLADMGKRPDGMSIDRINNNGNYNPKNCRWATSREQSLNRRVTVFLSWNGKTQCMADWAKELGIRKSTMHWRLRHWTLEKALTTR